MTLALDELRQSGRATISVEEAGALFGWKKQKAYSRASQGRLPGCVNLADDDHRPDYIVRVPALLRFLDPDSHPATSDRPTLDGAELDQLLPTLAVLVLQKYVQTLEDGDDR
jgi:hypothetical protein